MIIKWDRLDILIVCMLCGVGGIAFGCLQFSNRAELLDRERTWPRAEGKVWAGPVEGEKFKRMIVWFTNGQGKASEGFLFDNIDHTPGEVVSFRFDPNVNYAKGSGVQGKEILTDDDLSKRIASNGVATAVGCLAVGIAFISFAAYRFIRLRRSLLITTSYAQPAHTGHAAPITAKEREALRHVPNYDGERRQETTDLIVAPPPEIGLVTAAESNIPISGPGSQIARFAIGAVIPILILVGFFWAATLGEDHSNAWGIRLAGIVFAVVVFAFHWWKSRYTPSCTFIGQQGMARCIAKASHFSQPLVEFMRFDQAVELRAARTDHYVQGLYTGTTFDFTWMDAANRIIWRIKGKYRKKRKNLVEGDAWRFAQAAESIWTAHFLPRANQQLADQGSISFRLDQERSIQLGRGFIEFSLKGEPVRLRCQQISSVTLARGRFAFKTTDSKWYSLTGKFSFPYGDLANAQVFIQLLRDVVGCHVTDGGA